MRFLTLTVVLLGNCCVGDAAEAEENLVRNPGFEEGQSAPESRSEYFG